MIGDSDTKTAAADGLLGRVGIVFATPANQLSASKLTVREELAFGLENLGVPRAEMDGRIDAVLDRLVDRAISPTASRSPCPAGSSSGWRSPASSRWGPMSWCWTSRPPSSIRPGPTSVADLLDGLARSGTAILCAEHARASSAAMDRCLVLDAGRPVALDRPGPALLAAGARSACDPRRSSGWPGSGGRHRPEVRRGRDRGGAGECGLDVD